MTMKVADVAPGEAQMIDISEQLSETLSNSHSTHKIGLELDVTYLEAARAMLATLSERVAPSTSGTVTLTKQQIEAYLDFDPDYLDTARDMLRDFIIRAEALRRP